MTFVVIEGERGRRGHRITVYRPHRRDRPRPKVVHNYTEVDMAGFFLPDYSTLRLGLPTGRKLPRRWKAECRYSRRGGAAP